MWWKCWFARWPSWMVQTSSLDWSACHGPTCVEEVEIWQIISGMVRIWWDVWAVRTSRKWNGVNIGEKSFAQEWRSALAACSLQESDAHLPTASRFWSQSPGLFGNMDHIWAVCFLLQVSFQQANACLLAPPGRPTHSTTHHWQEVRHDIFAPQLAHRNWSGLARCQWHCAFGGFALLPRHYSLAPGSVAWQCHFVHLAVGCSSSAQCTRCFRKVGVLETESYRSPKISKNAVLLAFASMKKNEKDVQLFCCLFI